MALTDAEKQVLNNMCPAAQSAALGDKIANMILGVFENGIRIPSDTPIYLDGDDENNYIMYNSDTSRTEFYIAGALAAFVDENGVTSA